MPINNSHAVLVTRLPPLYMNTYKEASHAVLCFARCCTNSPAGAVGLAVVVVIVVLEVLVG